MLFLLRVSLYAIENLLPPLQGPRLTALFDEMHVGIFDAAKSQKVTKRQKPKKGGPDPKIIYQTISRLFWYAVPDIFHAAIRFNANRQIFWRHKRGVVGSPDRQQHHQWKTEKYKKGGPESWMTEKIV